ncbi:MAG: peptidylprolyl isomerase [Candidatus Abyssubacteria bacterium]
MRKHTSKRTLGILSFRALHVAAFISILLFAAPALCTVIDGIAIIVNKDAILVSEINEAMMPLMQEYRQRYSGDELKKKMNELRETVIEQAIDTKLILQIAKQKGLQVDEKAVDARMEVVKERFPSEDDFLQALAEKGLTYREYRDQVAEQVLVQETIRQVLGADIRVSDNEIQEYYDTHREEFVTEPKLKLAQIFFTIPADADPQILSQLQQKAEQVRILAEDGLDFSELATKYSEGPYKEKGGVIGTVNPNDILPEIKDIAFGLKAGEISPVIQTDYGLHILKALEVAPARTITFSEARPIIENLLHEKKRSEKYKDWIKKLRKDSYIDIKI